MEQPATSAKLAIVVSALALLTVPMSALASHNSVGVGAQVAQADEYEITDGPAAPLAPDVPADSKFDVIYHNDTAPRSAPNDQTGDRYKACQEFGQLGANYAPTRSNDHCYVGYFDAQFQYVILTSLLFTRGQGDPLYFANPASQDEFCTGEDKPREHVGPSLGILLVDEAIARADRSQSSECAGSGHTWYTQPADTLAVDTDLLEPGTQGSDRGAQDGSGAADALGTEEGSGVLTFPFLGQQYVFAFGQPHPDNPNPSPYKAGAGPFGPSAAAGGTPVTDLSGACGQRTKACTLLTPRDLALYDANAPGTQEGRLCGFQPQFFTVNPGALETGPCGFSGTRLTQFLPSITQGGFGAGAAPTWLTTLPGWHGQALFLNHQSSTLFADFNCDGGSFCHDLLEDGDQRGAGTLMYYAINPKVPDSAQDPLWCVRPNFIGEETDGTVNTDEFSGYVADAIDSDVYTHFLQKPVNQDLRPLVHGPARTALSPAQDVAPDRGEVTNPETLNDPLAIADDEALEEQLSGNVPPQVLAAIDRADYAEEDNNDPDAAYNTPTDDVPGQNQGFFDVSFKEGLRCNAAGAVKQLPQVTHEGGLRLNADLSQTTQLKDPTLLEGNLPAKEDDTHHGDWAIDLYSFNGPIQAVLDTNNNTAFDGCVQALGQPQPQRDACPWQGLWDAYNSNCKVGQFDPQNSHKTCGWLLEQWGYEVNNTGPGDANEPTGAPSGVGLYATLKIAGPVVTTSVTTDQALLQQRTHVLGRNDTTATNCIIAISKGLESHLATHLADATSDDGTADTVIDGDEKEALCPDTVDIGPKDDPPEDGEVAVILDAFNDQSGINKGGFSAAFSFAKLAPTPNGLRSAGGFGANDELCVNALFTVDTPAGVSTQDTKGNLDLTSTTTFTDCDPLATST